MIGRIRGTLVHKQPPDILVDVGGVGYEVQVPMTTLFQLPELGSEVSLVTHFVVREDAQQLYGFAAERDRAAFPAVDQGQRRRAQAGADHTLGNGRRQFCALRPARGRESPGGPAGGG